MRQNQAGEPRAMDRKPVDLALRFSFGDAAANRMARQSREAESGIRCTEG
jgi:hypothetical protein